jgi:hypothetical protein
MLEILAQIDDAILNPLRLRVTGFSPRVEK